jgi:hypothetical protein
MSILTYLFDGRSFLAITAIPVLVILLTIGALSVIALLFIVFLPRPSASSPASDADTDIQALITTHPYSLWS